MQLDNASRGAPLALHYTSSQPLHRNLKRFNKSPSTSRMHVRITTYMRFAMSVLQHVQWRWQRIFCGRRGEQAQSSMSRIHERSRVFTRVNALQSPKAIVISTYRQPIQHLSWLRTLRAQPPTPSATPTVLEQMNHASSPPVARFCGCGSSQAPETRLSVADLVCATTENAFFVRPRCLCNSSRSAGDRLTNVTIATGLTARKARVNRFTTNGYRF